MEVKYMSQITENVKAIIARVSEAARRAGKRPEDIVLLAASKMNDASRVREAYDAGIRFFGENRVQEMEEKLRANAYDGAELHFIGHLQRNKVKNVVGKVRLIESVDSDELIELIGKRADAQGMVQSVLLEVNIGGEENKSGVKPEEAEKFLELIAKTSGIKAEGLMAIPPVCASASETRRYFDDMRKLFIDIGAKKYDNVSMKFLSMGMSSDFEEAILAGANLVRVGTGIFGARDYSRTTAYHA